MSSSSFGNWSHQSSAAYGTMAFLFKSKKAADKAQSSREVGSQSSLISGNGNGNGRVQSEKPAGQSPGSSVNNSMNSLPGGGTATPSPEQQANGRRAQSTDMAQDVAVSVNSGDDNAATG